jgi:hypothetical protein
MPRKCKEWRAIYKSFRHCKIAEKKPVIFMKVGRSEVGAAAANSHTASLGWGRRRFMMKFCELMELIEFEVQKKCLMLLMQQNQEFFLPEKI